ncbi:HET-domain-containing protein [Apiospora rasikravindrae]|uniref:HET-domain-containing protein n=1 Tax=Apiospora rasikravindrae TaxID=990691 RepID=A0ABR1S294_9PEZI
MPAPLIGRRDNIHQFNYDPEHVKEATHSCRVVRDELTVSGAKSDNVVESCGPLADFHQTRELCRGISSKYSPEHSDLGEVLWRTMVANTFQRMPAPGAMGQSFRYWLCGQLVEKLTPGLKLLREEEGNIHRVELNDGKIKGSLGVLDELRNETVLRPREDGTYMLMGETYVHGFMVGEMKDQIGDLEDIVL